ncbi:MAG: NADH-quinone oxidoreductase subunit L [Aquincola sp.]|nr:NADH-quinone oxidoreductase subunit L [Aquincola sp.]MDH4288272.1 NADH-quinone oxidoreductase subunit L [Aquincola sp.]MDH5331275.1 NADH-quinone oxidoreductase subunit L [Aquincola sp.]
MSTHLLGLIVALPLAGFLFNGILSTRLGGERLNETAVNLVACALPGVSFVLTLVCFMQLETSGKPLIEATYTWATIGGQGFEVGFWFDRLAAVMTLVVTGVGTLIHVYSTGYMHGDKSHARYFAYLNLFLFFMLLLVLGRSLLVMFVGWEGVGLASYLLIGFWFDDPAKAAAGKKAFITNRIGDAGFLIGMFLLWGAFGTLDMDAINAGFLGPKAPAVSASLVGLMLFIGACGKSAQIPLHVWLPDAMAGPTPVSALIHAATMVTAGIYLVARMSGIYSHAPEASMVVAAIGGATAFFAATIAVAQTDIKKVLAYSTVSQLGLMFVALGVGAYAVAIFHVVTHAFFKACLFLGSGSVIHALGGEQDIRKMGGLARRIPVTFVTFAVATTAIAGIPPLAGFFSKDEILWFAFASSQGGAAWLWALASAASLLTSFYMFRLLWLTFFGASRMTPEVEHHVHESPLSMTGVLVVLALLSAFGGFIPVVHYLEPMLPLPAVPESLHHLEGTLVIVAVVLAFGGLFAAAWFFAGTAQRAARVRETFAGVYRWLANKYYIDELYEAALGRPFTWLSDRVFLQLGDRTLIDGALHAMAASARRGAAAFGALQAGSLHRYALYAVVGVLAAVLWSLRHG